MNYKTYLYVIFVFLSIYSLSCLNYEKFIKKDKVVETRILLMLLGLALGYIITNFVFDFLQLDTFFRR